jgi:tetratricopeptide (TPR) repeat protein
MPHCTECGNELRGSEKFCGECGAPIASSGVTVSGGGRAPEQRNVETLMGMARTAELGMNNSEALEYYNRALEIDPTITEAWLGKGRSASWQSTLANFRVSEGLIAFQHAIANAGEDREAVVAGAVEEINKIVSALYRMSRSHMEEYAALDNTWVSYINQVAQMLDALEQARNWAPSNRIVLENIVHLTKDNIEGYKYWDNIHSVSGLHGISPQYEETLRAMMDRAVAGLRQIDETYQAPTIEKKQAGACFVVTAAMGDASHPDVIALRRFRDEWLRKWPMGRLAISWYYHVGPTLAAHIGRSALRKRIAHVVLVRPAVMLASRKLR